MLQKQSTIALRLCKVQLTFFNALVCSRKMENVFPFTFTRILVIFFLWMKVHFPWRSFDLRAKGIVSKDCEDVGSSAMTKCTLRILFNNFERKSLLSLQQEAFSETLIFFFYYDVCFKEFPWNCNLWCICINWRRRRKSQKYQSVKSSPEQFRVCFRIFFILLTKYFSQMQIEKSFWVINQLSWSEVILKLTTESTEREL